jgi:two-component system, OmpR family, response regulator VicR
LGSVEVDFKSFTARKDGRPLHLTRREFEILRYLAERPYQVIFRDELLHEVWGYSEMPTTRSVDVAIGRLRKKVERDTHHPEFIHMVYGDGYYLTRESAVDTPVREVVQKE